MSEKSSIFAIWKIDRKKDSMYSKNFDIQDITSFKQWIAEAKRVVLVSHMNADGDACGSILGMSLMVESATARGALVTPMLPNGCPEVFKWMPRADRILNGNTALDQCRQCIAEADMLIALDLNTASRTDMLSDDLRKAQCRKVLIDHHHNPARDEFDLVFSDADISSTCELALWLSEALWGEQYMTTEVATCLYTGLNTDTGGFAFSCEQPSCFEAAAKLVQHDIHPSEIHNLIVNTFSINRMRFYGYALNSCLRLYPAQHVAMMVFSLEDQRRFGVGGEDMEGLVNYTLMMKDMEVGALIREEASRTKVSLRSKHQVNVNAIATQLGGGGHTQASGATCYKTLGETVADVKRLLGVENVEPMKFEQAI